MCTLVVQLTSYLALSVSNILKRKKKIEVSSGAVSAPQGAETPELEVVEADEVIGAPDDLSVEDIESNSGQSTHSTVIDLGEVFGDTAVDDDEEGNLPAVSSSERSGLVPYSPLEAYLSEIRRFKPLTREEEQIVAEEYLQTKSRASAYKLVSSNLWLVVKLAREYERIARNALDLIQEGNIGLMEAVRNFDPHRGVRFPSYAVWWIRQSILQALAEQSRIVRLPLNKVGSLNKINKAFSELEQEFEREPSPEELATLLEIPTEEVETTLGVAARHVSMDAPFVEGEDNSLLDVLENAGTPGTDQELDYYESLRREIERSLSTLTDRQCDVIKLYFGIGVEHPMSLEDIGDKFGLTRERVRQIKDKAINKLRSANRSRLLKNYLGA